MGKILDPQKKYPYGAYKKSFDPQYVMEMQLKVSFWVSLKHLKSRCGQLWTKDKCEAYRKDPKKQSFGEEIICASDNKSRG